jgi:hypothetical protein
MLGRGKMLPGNQRVEGPRSAAFFKHAFIEGLTNRRLANSWVWPSRRLPTIHSEFTRNQAFPVALSWSSMHGAPAKVSLSQIWANNAQSERRPGCFCKCGSPSHDRAEAARSLGEAGKLGRETCGRGLSNPGHCSSGLSLDCVFSLPAGASGHDAPNL